MASRLSQPGCHINTSSTGKRRLVKLDEIPPGVFLPRDRMRRRNSLSLMRGLAVKKKESKGKKLLGRQSSILQFSSKRVDRPTVSPSSPRDAVRALLSKFRSFRTASWSCIDVIKSKYPGLLVNQQHRTWSGIVPGVEIGDLFYCRAELSLVGLHRLPEAGIDSASFRHQNGSVKVAVSIVLSGGYEDNVDQGETVIYTGQGGNDRVTRRQVEHQKLEAGNLALLNSHILQTSVRVIRGRSAELSGSDNVYSYDGLYKVVQYQASRGISNFNVYKFKLEREPNQKPLRWFGGR